MAGLDRMKKPGVLCDLQSGRPVIGIQPVPPGVTNPKSIPSRGATSAGPLIQPMTGRYAILLDGGFVEKRLASRNRRPPDPADILAECARIRAHPQLAGCALLRIYYYDAPPATGSTRHPCTGRQVILELTDTHRRRARFLDELELCPDIALRLGEVAMRGWRVRRGALAKMAALARPLQEDDVELHLEQKGVDLRLGLDIARLALRQLVDTLVVVTGDSDMIPAFKFARREGLRVLLDHLDGPIRRELRAHADLVL